MVTLAERLERIRVLTAEKERRRKASPVDHIAWLPGQLAFLSCPDKRKLYRAGGQNLGKTTAGAAELIYRMRGSHPFNPDVKPIEDYRTWVVCGTHRQSRIVQRKVWELIPRELLADGCMFDAAKGAFLGEIPRLRFRNGAVAEFLSGNGKSVGLASESLHDVWIDEPLASETVYDELQTRVMKSNGCIYGTLTPINNPIDYLKRLCSPGEDGSPPQIVDLHYRLLPENLIPVGHTRPITLRDGTVCDADWIASLRRRMSAFEAPIRLDGHWETRAEGGYFDGAWRGTEGDDPHVVALTPKGKHLRWCLGVDHGHKPGRQIAVCVVVDETNTIEGHPHIYVVSEVDDPEGWALPERDAKGIRRMLSDLGKKWSDLTYVYGDRVHMPGAGTEKSNLRLAAALAKAEGVPLSALHPAIRGAVKGRDSRSDGQRWLYEQLIRGTLHVHPRCKRLVAAFAAYDDTETSEHKDPIDALRYALTAYVRGWWRQRGGGRGLVVG
jgi:hypothetical protein